MTKLEFVLVDLASQAKAVAKYTEGWNKAVFLDWLTHFGRVKNTGFPSLSEDGVFRFTSFCGLHASFRFTEENELVILNR